MVLRTFAILLISFHCRAQAIKLSKGEKCWALLHPFAALKINKINKKAVAVYQQKDLKLALDDFSNGGKLDAFRHAFFMAAFTQKIKVKKIRKLGIIHEKANYKQFLKSQYEEGEIADSLSCVMDLRNNELGFRIGHNNKKADLETIKKILIDRVNKGEAFIMKRNNRGNYLDCAGQILITVAKQRKWHTEKCLVSSDYLYAD